MLTDRPCRELRFYGVCAVISFFLVQRFIAETKGKELEAMEG
jgi:SP family sugar:H+ symporter-like MFS transporter